MPCDIHCVTKWSKLGTSFRGVSVDILLEAAEPLDAYAMAYSYGGYTTNLAIEDLTDGKAWVVTEHEGEPLPREHGGPARLLVPHLYFWKSAKWVRGCGSWTTTSPASGRPTATTTAATPGRRSAIGRTDGEPLTPVEQRAPGRWQIGTVTSIKPETPRVKSFRLELPMWMPHLPGQHYDVRLTAPDGYRAQRSYSVASSPLDEGEIELTIDRLDDGEVSPYFHDVVVEGDQVEVRGPFASYFVWRGEAPVLLVGGGSGVVPLMAMLRHRRRTMPELPMRLVYSVRTAEDVIYADELGDDAVLTYTREPPAGWSGHRGRIDAGADRRGRGRRRARPSSAARTASSRRPRSCCSRRASSRSGSAPSASARPADSWCRVRGSAPAIYSAAQRRRGLQFSPRHARIDQSKCSSDSEARALKAPWARIRRLITCELGTFEQLLKAGQRVSLSVQSGAAARWRDVAHSPVGSSPLRSSGGADRNPRRYPATVYRGSGARRRPQSGSLTTASQW